MKREERAARDMEALIRTFIKQNDRMEIRRTYPQGGTLAMIDGVMVVITVHPVHGQGPVQR